MKWYETGMNCLYEVVSDLIENGLYVVMWDRLDCLYEMVSNLFKKKSSWSGVRPVWTVCMKWCQTGLNGLYEVVSDRFERSLYEVVSDWFEPALW